MSVHQFVDSRTHRQISLIKEHRINDVNCVDSSVKKSAEITPLVYLCEFHRPIAYTE